VAAIVVATVVLLCQATAWVHAAATPHVTCLEHGESVHLAVATIVPAATAAGGVTVLAASKEAGAHAHEHCSLQGQRTTQTGSPARTSAVATFALAPVRAVGGERPPVQLLRLAPKTSPPRAPAA
jgi:hypothetical protein